MEGTHCTNKEAPDRCDLGKEPILKWVGCGLHEEHVLHV